MSNGPMISVIVPVYNAEKYLRKCVDSIVDQTYRKLEIILVDDGSQDNSGTICDEYAQSDRRVKVIHKENGGPSSARNEGIKAATGDYVAFVDSDDWLDVTMYEDVVFKAAEDADAIMYNLKYVNENSESISASPELKEGSIHISNDRFMDIYYLAYNSLLGYICNKLWKRSMLKDESFLNITLREDLCFAMKMLNKIRSIYCVDVCGYNYVLRPTSLLHSCNKNNAEAIAVVDSVISAGIKKFNKKNNSVLYNMIMQIVCTEVIVKDIIKNDEVLKKEKLCLIKKIVKNRAMIHKLKFRYSTNKLSMFILICMKMRQSFVLTRFLSKAI